MTMIINCFKKDFLLGLTLLQNITSKKGTISILSNVLINTLQDCIELTGTDLEIGIKTKIPADIISPGSITLPSKKLFEIVRETSNLNKIKLEENENNWVKITSGSSIYNLAGMPVEDFPSFPEYEKESLISISSDILINLIDKTSFCIGQDTESSFTLTGALFEYENKNDSTKIKMVTSDSHRLSYNERKVDFDFKKIKDLHSIIIPKKGIYEIRKFCDYNEEFLLGIEEKQLNLISDDSIIIIRLMNGNFPNYKNIIPDYEINNFFEINRNLFLESLKRINLLTEEQFNSINFYIDKNKIILSSQEVDIGNATDTLEIEYSGEKMNLIFNCRYFIDVLQIINSENVQIYLTSQEGPCLIKTKDDPDFLSIIMPMKV